MSTGMAVIAAVVAEQRLALGFILRAGLGSRRTANARATLIHRLFIPMWITSVGSYKAGQP